MTAPVEWPLIAQGAPVSRRDVEAMGDFGPSSRYVPGPFGARGEVALATPTPLFTLVDRSGRRLIPEG